MTELKKDKTLYIQIASLIRSNIYSGEYEAGERLPTENELCDIFSVSKITVRKAIQILEKQGLIKKFQGKGTFVQYTKENMEIGKNPVGFSGFYSSKGHQVTSEFLQTKIINDLESVPSEIVDNIELPLAYVQRIIKENNSPVGIDNVYVSSEEFPKFIESMLATEDLYKTLKTKYNVTVEKARLKINGIVANEYLADQLNCTIGDPLFVVDKLGYTAEDKLIHFSESIVRCDRVEYTFTL